MSIDLSLDRIRKLLTVFPTPYTRPTIHIAGTNGKGSLCAFVSSILIAAHPPLVVGRFNSPHLLNPLDAICIQNRPVTADVFWLARKQVLAVDEEHAIGATNFELFTAFALLVFERTKVDLVVLEVGMGGRLDATNGVFDECILVSALTAVDLDHQAFLGNTVEEITREKAAIARRARPFVLGPQVHRQVQDIARLVVEQAGADLHPACVVTPVEWVEEFDGAQAQTSTDCDGGIAVPLFQPVQISLPCFSEPIRALLPLHGEHQLGNLGTAAGIVSALLTHPSCERFGLDLRKRLTPAAISRGIQATRWPGRLSYHTVTIHPSPPSDADGASERLLVLADGAHNPASASALAAYLAATLRSATRASGRPLVLTYILALSHSPPKTPAQTLAPLLTIPQRLAQDNDISAVPVRLGAALLAFSPPLQMPWVRSVPPVEIRAALETLHRDARETETKPESKPAPEPEIEFWQEDAAPAPQPVSRTGEETAYPEPATDHVARALRWAAGRRRAGEDALVVLAGSLYLVADFYRLLEKLGQAQEIWGAN